MNKNNLLAETLFEKVQSSQGYAFISDSITGLYLNDEDVLAIAKNSLLFTEITALILKKFIKENTIK